MTNPTKYKVLPGGLTCRPVHENERTWIAYPKPYASEYREYLRTAPTYTLTEPMEEGKEFSGEPAYQIKKGGEWVYCGVSGYLNNGNDITRTAIQPVKEEKEVPKASSRDKGMCDAKPPIPDEFLYTPTKPYYAVRIAVVDANKEEETEYLINKIWENNFHAIPEDDGEDLEYLRGEHILFKPDFIDAVKKIQQSQSVESKDEVDLEINRLQWFEEEVESIHKWLDKQDAPTHNDNNKLSVVGRFTKLQSKPSIESIVGFVLEWVAERTGAMYPYNDQDTKQNILNMKADIIKELKK